MKCDAIVICDDDLFTLNSLKESITHLFPDFDNRIFCCSNGYELEYFLSQKTYLNVLILLDIKLKESNGITEAINLQKVYTNISVIFITAYTEYLTDIFDAKPSSLLFKPIDDTNLKKAILEGFDALENNDSSSDLLINVINEGSLILNYNDIIYIESDKRIINIHTINRVYSTYMKISDILGLLPDSFICCHKSYVINSKMVKSFTKYSITLVNGIVIPISRANADNTREQLFSRLRTINTKSK